MKILMLMFAMLVPGVLQAAISLPQANSAPATYTPKAYTANYVVFRNGNALGDATVRFSSLGNGRWELTTNTTGTGIAAIAGVVVDERSVLRWNDGKPETIDYSFDQKAGWKAKNRSIKVNAKSRSIESQDNEKFYTLDYQPGVLDRHAVTVALMRDLTEGNRGNLSYPVADRNEMQNHTYRVMGSEKIQTTLGMLNSLKVQRIRETSNGRATTLWLGTDKQFVPLRIEQKEGNGDVVDMRIKSLR